jgi:hypothetical protein
MVPKLTAKTTLLLLACLFLFEVALILMVMAIYMKAERSFPTFLASKPGIVFLLAIGLLLLAGAVITYRYLASARLHISHFRSIVMINLVITALLLLTVEITLRVNSVSSQEGEVLFGTVLRPLNWSKVALHYRGLVDHQFGQLSYLVHDDTLGWTVGPNRQKVDGLYSTDSNGIRISHSETGLTKRGGKTPIALMGDSHTFGQEVAYEDTWGYMLEKSLSLGAEFEVLNFGVPGYGMDQAFLRFERNVRSWKPKILIYALNSGAINRALIVYPFPSRPDWNLPFSKPRLILQDGEVKTINIPALSGETIFIQPSVLDLPFLKYDIGYKQSDWQHKPYHFSYLARLFVSRFPRWSLVSPAVSDEALLSLNISILRAFVRSAEQSGVIPIVVHLPQPPEVERPALTRIGKQVLEKAHIQYVDLMPCLLKLNPADRLVPSGDHYSPHANAAIANCLRNAVNESLAIQKPGQSFGAQD